MMPLFHPRQTPAPPQLLSSFIHRLPEFKKRIPLPLSSYHGFSLLALYFCPSPSWSSSSPLFFLPLFLLLFAKYPESPPVCRSPAFLSAAPLTPRSPLFLWDPALINAVFSSSHKRGLCCLAKCVNWIQTLTTPWKVDSQTEHTISLTNKDDTGRLLRNLFQLGRKTVLQAD